MKRRERSWLRKAKTCFFLLHEKHMKDSDGVLKGHRGCTLDFRVKNRMAHARNAFNYLFHPKMTHAPFLHFIEIKTKKRFLNILNTLSKIYTTKNIIYILMKIKRTFNCLKNEIIN